MGHNRARRQEVLAIKDRRSPMTQRLVPKSAISVRRSKSRQEKSPVRSAQTRSEPILIVEDELLIRLDMARVLGEAGFDVIEVANPDDALTILQTQAVSIMINDIEMFSSVDGAGLAWLVHETWPAVDIVVVSGLQRSEIGALPEGTQFLPKPFQAQELIDIVQQRLR